MQYCSENFESWWPMEMWHVYQTSAESDSRIQCLSTIWISKFHPFPASFSKQVKDLPMECWWYPPKISWTSRSTYQLWHWYFGCPRVEITKNWQDAICRRIRHGTKRSQQHPWRWDSTFYTNRYRLWKATFIRESWRGDPLYSSKNHWINLSRTIKCLST